MAHCIANLINELLGGFFDDWQVEVAGLVRAAADTTAEDDDPTVGDENHRFCKIPRLNLLTRKHSNVIS